MFSYVEMLYYRKCHLEIAFFILDVKHVGGVKKSEPAINYIIAQRVEQGISECAAAARRCKCCARILVLTGVSGHSPGL
jgi:hypothetical protein